MAYGIHPFGGWHKWVLGRCNPRTNVAILLQTHCYNSWAIFHLRWHYANQGQTSVAIAATY